MSINPCENCPEAALFRLNSKLKATAEVELEVARAKQAQLRAGRSALRNLWSEFAPTRKEWDAAHKLELAKMRVRRYSGLMPEELEEAINDCPAPFEQVSDTGDGTGDKLQTWICGARVALSNLSVSSHRMEAKDDMDTNEEPKETHE